VLDTPVLGTREPAEQGRLVVLLSGDAAVAERVTPVLQALGSRTVRVGERLGQASALKLACNAWVATLTAALGQSMALAGALGLDPALFLQAISGGPTDAPYAHAKGRMIQDGRFPVSFAVDGVVKDVGLMLAAADHSGVDATLLRAVLAVFERTSQAGRGGQDMAAVATAFHPTT
jgi:3-hydroxyisobutyrate dehydrogenase